MCIRDRLTLANMLQLYPSLAEKYHEDCAQYAKSTAIAGSIMLSDGDNRDLKAFVRQCDQEIERNREDAEAEYQTFIQSLGVRNSSGRLLASTSKHEGLWNSDNVAASNKLEVPLFEGRRKWGEVEFVFVPLKSEYPILGYNVPLLSKITPFFQLAFFLLLFGGVASALFLYLLFRSPKNSPSQSRVRQALSSLAEGLLVLDTSGRIKIASSVFCEKVGVANESLTNRRPENEFEWRDSNGVVIKECPWKKAAKEGVEVRDTMMSLITGVDDEGVPTTVDFKVNCSPVIAETSEGNGVLICFEDVTELQASKKAAESANEAKSDFLANMSLSLIHI